MRIHWPKVKIWKPYTLDSVSIMSVTKKIKRNAMRELMYVPRILSFLYSRYPYRKIKRNESPYVRNTRLYKSEKKLSPKVKMKKGLFI